MQVKKFLFSILFLSYFSLSVFGQYNIFSNFGSSTFLDLKTHIGKPVIYSDSLKTSLTNTFWAMDYRFGINSFDRVPQDNIMNFPNYGVGLSHYQMNSDTIGNPIGIYGFYSSPFFLNRKNIKIGFDLSTGVSFNFNTFNLASNPKNDLIGSKLNVYFNLGLWTGIRLTERLDLLSSLDFTHFSNGTMNTPNKGLNLYGGNFGLRYHFQFEEKLNQFNRKTTTNRTYEVLKPYNELAFWAAIGGKTILTPTYDGPIYFCSSMSVDLNRRYGWIGKYGIGTDLFYDHSLTADFPNEENIPHTRFTFVGVHANHEFIVGNFALLLQLGTYIWKGMEAKGNFYIRTGLRYDFTNHLFANISLKSANGLKADYIELGLGYRIGKKEKS